MTDENLVEEKEPQERPIVERPEMKFKIILKYVFKAFIPTFLMTILYVYYWKPNYEIHTPTAIIMILFVMLATYLNYIFNRIENIFSRSD